MNGRGQVPSGARAPSAEEIAAEVRGALDGMKAEVTKPIDVIGKVEAEITGQPGGAITIKVEGPGQITGNTVRGTGHAASVGTSMPAARYNPRNEGGR